MHLVLAGNACVFGSMRAYDGLALAESFVFMTESVPLQVFTFSNLLELVFRLSVKTSHCLDSTMLATVASGSRRLCQYGSVVHTDGAYDGRSAAQHETTARITLASVAVYTYTLGKGVLHPRLPSLAPRTVACNIGANTRSSSQFRTRARRWLRVSSGF